MVNSQPPFDIEAASEPERSAFAPRIDPHRAQRHIRLAQKWQVNEKTALDHGLLSVNERASSQCSGRLVVRHPDSVPVELPEMVQPHGLDVTVKKAHVYSAG